MSIRPLDGDRANFTAAQQARQFNEVSHYPPLLAITRGTKNLIDGDTGDDSPAVRAHILK